MMRPKFAVESFDWKNNVFGKHCQRYLELLGLIEAFCKKLKIMAIISDAE